eukprot:TRINITY_DN28679_c0_g1_i1.p1 TRINITY_DN28679_c0_g1~~TRINITY_DN28679_c0_g1_i1.p1  ORF type:complete len:156 (-),score=45.21 TRINITY_DN28679_c0_g1_i1:196-663(-)
MSEGVIYEHDSSTAAVVGAHRDDDDVKSSMLYEDAKVNELAASAADVNDVGEGTGQSQAEYFKEGLMEIFGPGVQLVENSFVDVIRSQDLLNQKIDALGAILYQVERIQSDLPIEEHLVKLRNSRLRMVSILETLERIHNRLELVGYHPPFSPLS